MKPGKCFVPVTISSPDVRVRMARELGGIVVVQHWGNKTSPADPTAA
ncbi:MAG TPA: hypothetical protein VLR92_02665 [Blastocatellia bacterium]|nr:hypothetical protein [Blastocatellia bacterium]